MARGPLGATLRQIDRLFSSGTVSGLGEAQLLERFVASRDEAAFEAVVARHGPMVLWVCRRVLRDPNDVEDAFQATFLVLVRKAGTLRRGDLLGNWLYGVAYRVALRARATAARRLARESRAARGEVGEEAGAEGGEPCPWLHEEIARLPGKYRAPIVLCYLEGLTHAEAAERLRCPVGTVKGRLARARDLLRVRLTRRGVALPSAALIAELAGLADAAVPLAWIRSATAAALAPGGLATAGVVSANVASITKGALHAMSLTKMKSVALSVLLFGVTAAGAGALAFQEPGQDPGPEAAAGVGPQGAAPDPDPGPSPRAKGGGRNAQSPPGSPLRKKAEPRRGGEGEMMMPGMMGMAPGMRGAGFEMPGRDPQSQAVLGKLAEPVTMQFANAAPLTDVLDYIKMATADADGKAIPIYLDRYGMKKAGIPAQSTIQIDLEGVPLRNTLKLLLGQLGLQYQVSSGILFIGADPMFFHIVGEASPQLLILGSHRGMAGMSGMGMMGMPGRDEMMMGRGGMVAGMMGGRAGMMSGMMMGGGMAGLAGDDADTMGMNEAIAEKLAKGPRLAFPEEQLKKGLVLEDVLKAVRAATRRGGDKGIPIYIDPKALKDSGSTLQSPVPFDEGELPPVIALRLILRTLNLAPTIRDGVLYIGALPGTNPVAK